MFIKMLVFKKIDKFLLNFEKKKTQFFFFSHSFLYLLFIFFWRNFFSLQRNLNLKKEI